MAEYDTDRSLRLGTIWDSEDDGQPSDDAEGDGSVNGVDPLTNLLVNARDEDGFVAYRDKNGLAAEQLVSSDTPAFTQCQFVELSVIVSVMSDDTTPVVSALVAGSVTVEKE